MTLHTLYLSLPVWAQEWAISLYARQLDRWYYGAAYTQWFETFVETDRTPYARRVAAQTERLREILRIAARHVPWWRAWATRAGEHALAIESPEALSHLPILEKDPLRWDPWQFVREDVPRNALWCEKTSGTTGTPLRIYWPRTMLPWWWALHEARVRHWAGVSQSLPRAMVGGRAILRGDTVRPPYWRYNRTWQQLYFSSYHISPATAPQYLDAMERYGSRWITGYGSAIALLGEYLIAHPRSMRMRAVLTSGDTVSPRQRQAIEEGFGCRMHDYYGSAEGCCVISECQDGRLHVQPEAGILEILDAEGQPCPPGVEGEFICTGLGNDVMPLIRYRTGDYGCWSAEQACPCGRDTPIVAQITGRTDDYLVLPDGRKIGRLSTAMKHAPSVKQAQLAQDAPDHAWLLVVPESWYREEDGRALVEDVLGRIGSRVITFDLCAVPEIPSTPAGKHVLVRRLLDDPTAQERYRQLIERGEKGVAA